MGTTVQKLTSQKSIFSVVVTIFAAISMSACAPQSRDRLNAPGVVQIESPLPNDDMPAGGGDIEDVRGEGVTTGGDGEVEGEVEDILKTSEVLDSSYKTLRVRVFPIMSVPAQDPYPKTIDPLNVSMYNSGGLEVHDSATKAFIGTYTKVVVDAKNLQLNLDGSIVALKRAYIQPVKSDVTTTVKYDNGAVKVEYRGSFYVRQSLHEAVNTTYWSLINYVSIDDYLLSVVPSEMPSNFGLEALKSQAVAARTYSLFHAWIARNTLKRAWDVDPTTWFQSYRGALVENSKNISPAVVATAGLVMTHSNKIIEAFFSSNSGGMLCSMSECFDRPDRPYIFVKADVDGVRLKPAGTWKTAADPAGIDARLNKLQNEGALVIKNLIPGYKGPQDISGLELFETGTASRVARLAIALTNGRKVVLDKAISKQMRWQFGMKTAYYDVDAPVDGKQDVVGYGLGHGVGMSQWGARILSDQGKTYEEILKFYYNGIDIQSL